MNISPLDRSSPELTSPQIRDFGNRVLLNAVVQHIDGEEWTEFSTEARINLEGHITGVLFTADWDDETEVTEYAVTLERIEPFNEEWNIQAAQGYVGMGLGSDLAYSGSIVEHDDAEEAEGAAIDVSDIGYFGLMYQYTFIVPEGHHPTAAFKSASIDFYDEDCDPVDSEVLHHNGVFGGEITPRELEALWAYGEKILDTDRVEKGLSALTLNDLEVVLAALKKFGLVNKRAVALRADLRPLELS